MFMEALNVPYARVVIATPIWVCNARIERATAKWAQPDPIGGPVTEHFFTENHQPNSLSQEPSQSVSRRRPVNVSLAGGQSVIGDIIVPKLGFNSHFNNGLQGHALILPSGHRSFAA